MDRFWKWAWVIRCRRGRIMVGVISTTGTSPFSYTLVSRGIGTNFSIPVINLPFTNGVATTNLVGREVAYYSIVVPTNLPSWRLELSNNVGESLMMLQEKCAAQRGGGRPGAVYLVRRAEDAEEGWERAVFDDAGVGAVRTL